jgi:hypothetical protein
MHYDFQRRRVDKIPREKILEELVKVAGRFDYHEFSIDEFNKVSIISAGTVKNEFGSWRDALTALRHCLATQGRDLSPRQSRSNVLNPTEEQLFTEMDRVWKKLQHRPSCDEWKSLNPAFSLGTYRYRFGGWTNACLKFIEYEMGGTIVLAPDEGDIADDKTTSISEGAIVKPPKISSSRNIPAGMRVRVLDRDNFRCVFCGRSPATDVGVRLHIDHIRPFSKGGRTTMDNLQTLCQDCNLGKSNSDDMGLRGD